MQVVSPYWTQVAKHYWTKVTEPYWTQVPEPYQTPYCRALLNTSCRALLNTGYRALPNTICRTLPNTSCRALPNTSCRTLPNTSCRALQNTSCRALLNPCSMFQDPEQQQPDVARQGHVRGHVQTADPPSVGQQSHLWLSLGLAGTLVEEGTPSGAVHQVLLSEPAEGTERGRPARSRV